MGSDLLGQEVLRPLNCEVFGEGIFPHYAHA